MNHVDTSQTITHVGLCAGYGGIELGLKRVISTLRTVALCEIEAFAIANLVAKMEAGLMDPAPIWTDLKTFPWAEFRDRVDILTGGYPCQPFSAAGKRLGTEDERHLWTFIASGIRILKPRICFFENVEGHITLGLSSVISDLEELGYQVAWGIFSASECGASHQRKRVFILAHSNNQRLEGHWGHVAKHDSQGRQRTNHVWPSRPSQPQHAWEPPRVVGNAKSWMSRQSGAGNWRESAGGTSEEIVGNAASQRLERGKQSAAARPATDTTSAASWKWQTQPALGGNADGTPSGLDYAELCVSCDNRTDELRLLGNGVVPATAERAFRVLFAKLS